MSNYNQEITTLWPHSENPSDEAVNIIRRQAAIEAYKYLRDSKGFVHSDKVKELEARINNLTDKLKIAEGVRSHLAAQVAELSNVNENERFIRAVENRVERRIAELKAAEVGGLNPVEVRRMYNEAIRLETAQHAVSRRNMTMTPQLINKDIVNNLSKSCAPVIVYMADGRQAFMRWRDLYTYCNQSGNFDPSPYTHYTLIPKVTLNELLDDDNQANF